MQLQTCETSSLLCASLKTKDTCLQNHSVIIDMRKCSIGTTLFLVHSLYLNLLNCSNNVLYNCYRMFAPGSNPESHTAFSCFISSTLENFLSLMILTSFNSLGQLFSECLSICICLLICSWIGSDFLKKAYKSHLKASKWITSALSLLLHQGLYCTGELRV